MTDSQFFKIIWTIFRETQQAITNYYKVIQCPSIFKQARSKFHLSQFSDHSFLTIIRVDLAKIGTKIFVESFEERRESTRFRVKSFACRDSPDGLRVSCVGLMNSQSGRGSVETATVKKKKKE